MIFVTVGNATQPFVRLLRAVDGLAGQGFFRDEEVVIQARHVGGFVPEHCRLVPVLSEGEYRVHVNEASLVICHAGAGSLYHAFAAGKVPVVMPRRKSLGEHVEDQYAFVEALNAGGRISAAFEPEELPEAIRLARERMKAGATGVSAGDRMQGLVRRALEDLMGGGREAR
jgi:UDP-N-acetylglucosamine transferase subunit ALG13